MNRPELTRIIRSIDADWTEITIVFENRTSKGNPVSRNLIFVGSAEDFDTTLEYSLQFKYDKIVKIIE